MRVHHEWRRKKIKNWIDADPWDCVVYRNGTGDTADSRFSVVGRISLAGARGAPLTRAPSGWERGEMEQHTMANVLIVEWDETEIMASDIIHAEHRDSGQDVWFDVGLCRNLAHKREITLHEHN